MKDYIETIETELKNLQKSPFAFKGILSKYNLEKLEEKELFKIFYTEGVYIKRDPLHKYNIDNKNISKYGKYYGFSVINPILYYEFLSYYRMDILVYVLNDLFIYKHSLLTELDYKLKLPGKIKCIKKKQSKIFKKINKNEDTQTLFLLYKSQEFRKDLVHPNWLSVVDSDILFPTFISGNKLKDEIFSYISNSSKFTDTDSRKLPNYNKWIEIELLVHRLEFLNWILMSISDEENNDLNKNHDIFLTEISTLLMDKNDISIFEDVINLPYTKNIPFFTSVYNYFGIRNKKFNIDAPKTFFDVVNKSYHLKMSRLRGIDTPKYTKIEKVFKTLLDKRKT